MFASSEITETNEFKLASFDFNGEISIPVEVRIWHDMAGGMQAEPIRYSIAGQWYAIGAGITHGLADKIICLAVDAAYDARTLDHIRDTNPAFEDVPDMDDSYGLSQQAYQDMRI